ncbi:RNA-directed DNA polymerase, eukaryota, reverse transcriptase zinc-binding domain protein [Tanacetum coccineum]
MIGWNNSMVQAWLISQSRQYMFILVETIDQKSKKFCTIVYASNLRMEKRKSWKDLETQKIVTCGTPWVILDDFNVTLKVSEHSNGSAYPSREMIDFQECVNNIEVDDLHSEDFHYTWTKSLKNPKCRTLKKLDRVMVNEDRRFEGHTMYKVIQKEKALKSKLKQLSWKNGNVFLRAEKLREKVKEAMQDENSLLCQKAKIEWLREGDRNTAYFYKTIKERVHRGRIMTIRNEEGVRFENKDVTAQIVKHFEEFLGKSSIVQNLASRSDIFLNKLSSEEAIRMVRPIATLKLKILCLKLKTQRLQVLMVILQGFINLLGA